jgi:small-conductance mechanosensitive channel
METIDLQFSNFEIIGFAAIAVVIFLLLKGLFLGFPFIIKNWEKQKSFQKYYGVFEIVVWVLYVIFVIQQFSDSNQLYSIGLFLLLMLAGFWILWYYFKDYVGGGLFRFNSKFDINDSIQVNNYQGKIIKIGKFRLEIESESGEIIYIPYSQLSNAVIVKLHPGEMILSYSFTLSTDKAQLLEEKIQKLKYHILSMPYTSLKKSPQIKLIHEDKKHFVFEIVVFTLEKEFFIKIESQIRREFENTD